MRGFPGRPAATWCWVLLPLVVLAHLALAALAAAEFAAMGWPLPTWFDTGAVTLVLTTAAAGLAASAVVALRAVAGSRALRALIRAARRPVPGFLRNEAAALGLAARLDVVAGEDAFAITYGLIRPRIVVSTGLAAALAPAEIRAVLAHEREHLRHRDPLRLLAALLAAAWGWYLPAAGWLARRAALRHELAADQAAAGSAGPGVLAAAGVSAPGSTAALTMRGQASAPTGRSRRAASAVRRTEARVGGAAHLEARSGRAL
jgi:Zn-dependent protease with chaperone function